MRNGLEASEHLIVVVVELLTFVRLFANLCTVARQAPLSVEFSRQEYWSWLPFPFLAVLPNQGSNPGLLHCSQILYHLSYQGSPIFILFIYF